MTFLLAKGESGYFALGTTRSGDNHRAFDREEKEISNRRARSGTGEITFSDTGASVCPCSNGVVSHGDTGVFQSHDIEPSKSSRRHRRCRRRSALPVERQTGFTFLPSCETARSERYRAEGTCLSWICVSLPSHREGTRVSAGAKGGIVHRHVGSLSSY